MDIYNQIPLLLGYEVGTYNIVTDYFEKGEVWFEKNGIKIDFSGYKYHFISEKKIQEIISNLRDNNIDNILHDKVIEKNKIFDWKIFEPILFDFTVHFINQMVDNKITSVSNGLSGTDSSYLNDRCFNLNQDNLMFSKQTEEIYDDIIKKFECS